jgi:PLP dependent protein
MLPHLFQNCHASNLPKQKIVGELIYFAFEMSAIGENINRIRKEIPSNVALIVVTKTQSNERLLEAYEAGERIFGENRVQELVPKHEALPKDIEWHMIGHLQSNKVKYIAPFINCIHSIDDTRLLSVIDKEAAKHGRTIRVLLQFHIAQEETKFGLSLEEAEDFLKKPDLAKLKHISIAGVMGMATFTSDEIQVRNEFRSLKKIFDTLKTNFFSQSTDFSEISMGMSGDYKLAIEEGSTMVRVGSSIFGNRV